MTYCLEAVCLIMTEYRAVLDCRVLVNVASDMDGSIPRLHSIDIGQTLAPLEADANVDVCLARLYANFRIKIM